MKWGLIIVAVLAAAATVYFISTAQQQAVQTTTPTPATTAAVVTSAPPPPAVPFSERNYEVNYTYVMSVAVGEVSISLWGWGLEGVGLLGNYSVGVLTANLPPRGPVEVSYKAATEGGVLYVVNCLQGQCYAEGRPANYTVGVLLRGVNATAREVGRCEALGYAGVLVEERGVITPAALQTLLPGAQGRGEYVSTTCRVNGVPLTVKSSAYLNVTLYGQALTVKLTVEATAVKAGPFNATRYGEVLGEVKAPRRTSSAS
ncbi:hypothetical protein [Pyrobaculum calidifontis]|uniref:Uncharacterized protein n=1 Tax=Pyrobaculum calidifontis (strain DSM 21063 / JCM 11548 / VA1) TaxID=410359 RepID=A3MWF1_PYRCJ|nr:hypothetical protein [Pyrobaculum calidifontis]ABO08968.1 hypothetical protein Pcal_1550 [Pyrobaculum calidifontis JCM 11548]